MGRKYYIGSSEDWTVHDAQVTDWEWVSKEETITAFKVTLSVPKADGSGFIPRPVSIPKWKADESGIAAALEALQLDPGDFVVAESAGRRANRGFIEGLYVDDGK